MHLRSALRVCDGLGADIWATVARLHLGRLRRLTGDEAEGRGLLERAHADARGLGMAVVGDRAEEALAAAPRDPPPARTAAAPAG